MGSQQHDDYHLTSGLSWKKHTRRKHDQVRQFFIIKLCLPANTVRQNVVLFINPAGTELRARQTAKTTRHRSELTAGVTQSTARREQTEASWRGLEFRTGG